MTLFDAQTRLIGASCSARLRDAFGTAQFLGTLRSPTDDDNDHLADLDLDSHEPARFLGFHGGRTDGRRYPVLPGAMAAVSPFPVVSPAPEGMELAAVAVPGRSGTRRRGRRSATRRPGLRSWGASGEWQTAEIERSMRVVDGSVLGLNWERARIFRATPSAGIGICTDNRGATGIRSLRARRRRRNGRRCGA